MTRAEYVLARVLPEPNSGCWLWVPSLGSHGYGNAFDPEGPAPARKTAATVSHRVSYKAFKGPIPEGYQIDHKCRTRSCCNPDHLEAVTQQENLRRQFVAMWGHPDVAA